VAGRGNGTPAGRGRGRKSTPRRGASGGPQRSVLHTTNNLPGRDPTAADRGFVKKRIGGKIAMSDNLGHAMVDASGKPLEVTTMEAIMNKNRAAGTPR